VTVQSEVVALARAIHQERWGSGKDVGAQTKLSTAICVEWQKAAHLKFPGRFRHEHPLNEFGPTQLIDLVDLTDRVAYELKVSPNNVHMEIYRDVFKALVFNRRNPTNRIVKLVFIAPKAGIDKLGIAFVEDVKAIAEELNLILELEAI
jgi:hypothetical protein